MNDIESARPVSPAQGSGLMRRRDLERLGDYVPPADPSQAFLAACWREAMGIDQIGIRDDFFALGGTSIQAAAIFDAIERRFGISLPLATLYNESTIEALAARLDGVRAEGSPKPAVGAESFRRLVQIKPKPKPKPKVRGSPVFIVPGVGGGVVGLAYLAGNLGQQWDAFGLESRGLDGQEEPHADIPSMASEYLTEMRRVQPMGPYFLLGICWGGVVALEIAHQLESAGETVGLLAMLDPPPARPSPSGAAAARLRYSLALPRFLLSRAGLYWRTLRSLPKSERRQYLRRRLGVAKDVMRRRDLFRGDRTEFLRRKVHEANVTALRIYDPPEFQGPVYLMFTRDRPDSPSREGRQKWIRHFGDRGEICQVPGTDTGDAIGPALAVEVAAALRRRLEAAGATRPVRAVTH